MTRTAASGVRANAVVAGHRKAVAWMHTDAFQAYARRCDAVLGAGRVYFRATGSGVVQVILSDDAPGFVGFRTDSKDQGYLRRPGRPLPSDTELADRWRSFRRWLPSVRRESAEEQVVIHWMHKALRKQLRLPELGDGWVLLNQEWRFLDGAGKGKKSDVLAVHVASGRLGIVECKDDSAKRDAAVEQLELYAGAWTRDRSVLAPFFNSQLHAMAKVYGADAQVSSVTLSEGAAAQFFAWPRFGGMAVERIR